tara:strand:+ start:950 stop:1228 length:279 start_codon:yes stop_codon:yes gene_type:complete
MTKTELKKQQTQGVIELLENKFGATDFENDQGSYFTFFVGEFEGCLTRRDFDVMMNDSLQMGPGFSDEEYDVNAAAIVLEDSINEAIQKYLK